MTLVRTPLISSNVELSEGDGLYWKQVLPLDYKLDYNGHQLHFDKTYINNVITAYKQNALGDQVAFQLADDENRHDTPEDNAKQRNHDPQRFRGSVKAMKLLENDPKGRNGLWCGFHLTEAGKKLIDDNMELGVSASLSQGFDPQYPVIMRHVVGTIHPKVKNMAGWTKALVSLSDVEDSNEEVLSFMPEEKKSEKFEVSKEDWDSVMSYVKAKQEEDKEIAKLLEDAANSEEPTPTEDGKEKEPAMANLSELPEFKAMQERLNLSEANAANDRWQRERSDLAKAGVPKAMLDLAEPVMKRVGATTINLSDGSNTTDQDQMRKMLNEAKGFIDLSEEEGFGRSESKMTKEEQEAAKKDFDSILSDFTMNDTF